MMIREQLTTPYASVISRNRRTVLVTVSASFRCTRERNTHLRTVAAAVVDTVQAPPAITFLHDPHFQMPTAWRFTESCHTGQDEWFILSRGSHHAHLAAEGAGVTSVLSDFHLRGTGNVERGTVFDEARDTPFSPACAGRHRNARHPKHPRKSTTQLAPSG